MCVCVCVCVCVYVVLCKVLRYVFERFSRARVVLNSTQIVYLTYVAAGTAAIGVHPLPHPSKKSRML